ncbi:hypothetical protein E7744_11945 [Citricoccus sp. SGAir0253]|uniref:hypothetical protein n=1 Tax=Citricoccus sp. SGAir0253 TaxID=2567881 RepID=UPI0010CCD466|nr:hypothetical protein [Citricoccus sp. SGAir0253]QCU78772.1 hypothetical protein E7744_11945 [Citricoccus sp. SGAir0253]
MSVRPATSPETPPGPASTEASPWLRLLLIAGGALTAASFAALVLLLASYFLQVTAWPVFYWFGLYGLPLGFALMLAYVVAKAVLRRRA